MKDIDPATRIRYQLKDERERRGLSQAKLAALLRRSPVTIGSWERGDRHVHLPDLMQWAAALDLEPALIPKGARQAADPLQVMAVCNQVRDAYVVALQLLTDITQGQLNGCVVEDCSLGHPEDGPAITADLVLA